MPSAAVKTRVRAARRHSRASAFCGTRHMTGRRNSSSSAHVEIQGGARGHSGLIFTQVVEKKEAIEITCHGENGFGQFSDAEERPHDKKCPYKATADYCYTSLDKCSAKAAAYPSLKVCCFAERIIKPTKLDECDRNNTHSVAWIDRSKGKKNSTFFADMGYRGQSCDDWISLMQSFD